jgi:nitrile hydratase
MPKLTAETVLPILRAGDSARLPDEVPAKFKPGQSVRVRNLNPLGHTRAPRYIRGKTGTIDRDHGVMVFPDTNAAGTGKKPQHVYSVRFEGREVWGPDAPSKEAIYVDLWDDYLDPAQDPT